MTAATDGQPFMKGDKALSGKRADDFASKPGKKTAAKANTRPYPAKPVDSAPYDASKRKK